MKSLILSIAVGCSLFAFRTDAIGDMFCDSKSTTRNFCDGGDEEGIIEYDFGTKTTTYNSEFHFIASYSGKFNPVSFLIQTNLNFNFESIDDYTYEVYITLPNYDSSFEVRFVDDEDNEKIDTVYSTMNKEGLYGISTLSLYSAQYLVGNVEGQEYMDHDTIKSEKSDENQSENINGPHKVIAGGKIDGNLRWTDDSGNTYPLSGAKVKLTFDGSWGSEETYSDSNGYYQISFNGIWTAYLWTYVVVLHIYAENEMIKVCDDSGTLYEKTISITDMENNGNYSLSYTFSNANDLDYSMEIFSAGKNFSDNAAYLNGGTKIAQCKIKYPCDGKESASYTDGSNTIKLPDEDVCGAQAKVTVHEAWDTIGHEYGHFLQDKFFYHSYAGSHSSQTSDIWSYFDSNKNTNYDSDLGKAKKQGMGLAWSESWPTFFSIVAQKSFPNSLRSINFVGDDGYVSYLVPGYSLNAFDTKNGEACERTIMQFLYQLWDSATSAHDKISISEENLWSIMVKNNPEFFFEFISALYNSDLTFSRNDLGLLLEGFHLCPTGIVLTVPVSDNYSYIPSFSWDVGGADVSYNGKTYDFSNDKFILDFYDENQNLIVTSPTRYSQTYTPVAKVWNSILKAQGNKYYIVIKAYDTLGMESGPYITSYFEMSKPSKAEQNLTIANDRYYERNLTIAAGTSWIFHLKFTTSGTKMIQTFGNADTKIFLYESNGNSIIESDDDDGYGLNALIYRSFQTDTEYVLKISLYSSSKSGETKLSIASIYDENNETDMKHRFEDFPSVKEDDYTYSSYLLTGYSRMVTWKAPESGTYQFDLTSQFDNFLYMIDPSSSTLLKKDVDYNDDSDGTDARLTKTVTQGKTYAFICSPYNLQNSIGTNNDIVLKITVL